MIISMAIAMSKNRVIGVNNKLPWHLSDDLKNFKKITLNKTILMGRKTFESMGSNPLPNRKNIIVSKTLPSSSNYLVVRNLEEGILKAKELEEKELVIIGGGEIFKEAISLVDDLHLTVVDAEIEGDIYFPEVDLSSYQLINHFSHEKDEKNDYSWTYYQYKKK